nr:uncharacterized protein LOC129262495 [Lytechinus pictus]
MQSIMRYTVLAVFCICFCNVALSQNFVESPQDQTIREGQTVLFRCIIRNLQSNQNVYWFRLSTRRFLTVNRMVHSHVPQHQRLSILGNANLGEYHLQIRDVELEDAGTYRCGFAIPNMQFTFRSVVLVVLRPPNQGSPMCEFSPDRPDVDDVAMLTCRSEGGRPPARLTWRLGERNLTEPKESPNILSVVVSGEHNGREFICDSESPAVDEPRFCSVTLLSIRPDVRVEPPLGIAEVGGSIVFTCVAFGLPEIVRYEWLFDNNPVDDIQRIEVSRDGRTLIINDITLEDDESPVHCTATTTHGLSSTSGALLQVKELYTVEPTTINATGFYNDTMGELPNKTSGVIIAIIVIAVIVGQVLFVIMVYALHRYVNRMMKDRKARRRSAPVMRDMDMGSPPEPRGKGVDDMGENIYVGGVSLRPNDRSDIDPETGAPRVFYSSINESSFDSMGEGVYSQGLSSPPVGVSLGVAGTPAASPLDVPESGQRSSASPRSPIYSNAVALDQSDQSSQGRLPPPTAPPTSPSTVSESPYGYDSVPFVEAEEEPRRPPPPTGNPPRPPVVVTSPPPNKPPPRVPADKRQSNPKGTVPGKNEYCGLTPGRTESRYLSLCHYDEAYADQVLQQGARLNGEVYNPYDHPVVDSDDDHDVDVDKHHDDDGYVYELPPSSSSPDEVYDIPPDASKREYTFMGSNLPAK